MRLSDLEKYDPITIQCHDNPDADALASGYGLYCYFREKGKQVRLVYSGRNKIQKSNLRMMIEQLKLPVEYMAAQQAPICVDGLLITVDCQYGLGNVTGLTANTVAIVDHHQQEVADNPLYEINSGLGSCSTLVWRMLTDSGYVVDDEKGLGTALYYGLYTDTNQFTELHNPLDMDMMETVPHAKNMITLFRNSNLSLKELEIAGIAMIRYSYNEDYEFAVIKAQSCDPNILGLISDFLLQVDIIKTCVVFNEVNDGYKFSVRSCIREVNASELAAYLAEGMGSGGGHYEKAGGFISLRLYQEKHPSLHGEGYFNNRMVEYFVNHELIYAKDYEVDLSVMELYEKRKLPIGFVEASKILPVGTPITIRTLEGDIELKVEEDLYILIGIKGEVYPNRKEKFERNYQILEEPYRLDECTIRTQYIPVIKNRENGENLLLTDYARKCVPTGKSRIYVKELEKGVKVFTAWGKDKYLLGRPGDMLAVRCDDLHDIYVVERDVFFHSYDKVKEDRQDVE